MVPQQRQPCEPTRSVLVAGDGGHVDEVLRLLRREGWELLTCAAVAPGWWRLVVGRH